MKKVTIIQRILYQYRVDFYKMLKERLAKEGIALHLIIEENKSRDAMDSLDYFEIKKNKHFNFFGIELIYQPYLGSLNDSDLIILEVGNKLLLNYLLMFKRMFPRSKKIAFWGHALDMQIGQSSLKNRFKRTYCKNVDFWFPYTEGMSRLIKEMGFPEQKLSSIYNTIDTLKIIKLKDSICERELKSAKDKLGVKNSRVGIFCGRIYKEKRIDFLLQACFKIKERHPDFSMIFIGDGDDAQKVMAAANQYGWIKYVGPAFGKEKAVYFKMADVFLSPGLVGLSVLDSFALGVPMVTTDYPYHSAEIEYLKNGGNGIITEDSLDSFVSAVSELFNNAEKLGCLRKGCQQAAQIYTMENMVDRLTKGIKHCLNEQSN